VRAACASLLVLASGWMGCAVSARVADQVVVAPEDHHAYRSYRAADTLETKLQSAWRYVKSQPEGHYRDEVRGWFLRAERGYRKLAENRPDMLHGYLALLPDAPNAKLVVERLAELELARKLRVRREVELTVQAQEFEAQLSGAERQRALFVRGLSQWIDRLARLGPWGGPVGELGQEFLVVYTLQEPVARCDASSCTKQLSFPYVLPDRGTFAARSAEFDVVLALNQGVVVRAEIVGHALFDRIAEASQLTRVGPGDALARAESIGRAVQVTGQALDATFPVSRCAREAVSPVVLERECDGVRVRVVAAERPELPDRIEFVPTAPAAKPGPGSG
jgi:hypothetical protein